MNYQHTQKSVLMWLIAVCGALLAVWGIARLGAVGSDAVWALAAGLVLVVVGALAARLTVSVDDPQVTAAFGWGWPRRRTSLGEIAAAERVRTSWWQGWGIRKVRNGWMFNNAGSDAIELRLRSGRVFRIGTDQPEELFARDRAGAPGAVIRWPLDAPTPRRAGRFAPPGCATAPPARRIRR